MTACIRERRQSSKIALIYQPGSSLSCSSASAARDCSSQRARIFAEHASAHSDGRRSDHSWLRKPFDGIFGWNHAVAFYGRLGTEEITSTGRVATRTDDSLHHRPHSHERA